MPVSAPEHLFKYVTADVARIVIESGTTRWSSPLVFNDPDDARSDWRTFFHLDDSSLDDYAAIVQELLVSADPVPPLRDQWLWQLLTNVRRTFRGWPIEYFMPSLRTSLGASLTRLQAWVAEQDATWNRVLEGTRILCLTAEHTFPTMWEKFADDHRGAVLRFTPSGADSCFAPQPVRYDLERAVMASRVKTMRFAIGLEELSTDDIAEKVIYTKRNDLADEREWRCWQRAETADGCAERYSLIPYNPSELTAVYIGRHMADAARSELRSIIAAKVRHAEVWTEADDSDPTAPHFVLWLAAGTA